MVALKIFLLCVVALSQVYTAPFDREIDELARDLEAPNSREEFKFRDYQEDLDDLDNELKSLTAMTSKADETMKRQAENELKAEQMRQNAEKELKAEQAKREAEKQLKADQVRQQAEKELEDEQHKREAEKPKRAHAERMTSQRDETMKREEALAKKMEKQRELTSLDALLKKTAHIKELLKHEKDMLSKIESQRDHGGVKGSGLRHDYIELRDLQDPIENDALDKQLQDQLKEHTYSNINAPGDDQPRFIEYKQKDSNRMKPYTDTEKAELVKDLQSHPKPKDAQLKDELKALSDHVAQLKDSMRKLSKDAPKPHNDIPQEYSMKDVGNDEYNRNNAAITKQDELANKLKMLHDHVRQLKDNLRELKDAQKDSMGEGKGTNTAVAKEIKLAGNANEQGAHYGSDEKKIANDELAAELEKLHKHVAQLKDNVRKLKDAKKDNGNANEYQRHNIPVEKVYVEDVKDVKDVKDELSAKLSNLHEHIEHLKDSLRQMSDQLNDVDDEYKEHTEIYEEEVKKLDEGVPADIHLDEYKDFVEADPKQLQSKLASLKRQLDSIQNHVNVA